MSTEASTSRLRSAGSTAWAMVGIALVAVILFLLMAALRPMLLAVVIALFLAIVFSPLVDTLARRGLPRPAGAAIATVLLIAVAAFAAYLVVAGFVDQQQAIAQNLDAAMTRLQSMATSAGFDDNAVDSAAASVTGSSSTALHGLLPALGHLFGTVVDLVVGAFVALFTCAFLLNGGHAMSARLSARLPLPESRAKLLLDQAALTIRRYFVGLTVLGLFNAAVVVVGALILDVPLVGTIAVITLLGSYVPYIGALVAGAFAVLLALGSGGTSTALWMILVVFLANSVLQNLVSPFAYGAALEVSPLTLLLAALVGASLAGVVGVALSTPVTAILVHTFRLLRSEEPVAEVLDPVTIEGDPVRG